MLESALDKVVTLASEVLFERKPQTLTKTESTLGDRIGLRTSGQPEEPRTLKEKEVRVFLTSSLTKQVFKSPNKSTMNSGFIKNHSQKIQHKSITTLQKTEIQKFMLNK